MTDYIKIDWADVRAGDVLMHENGDRLTAEHVGELFVGDASGRNLTSDVWGRLGFTPHRRVWPVPTEPGAYHDRDGALCVLAPRSPGDPYPWLITHGGSRSHWTSADGEYIAERAPFTRLVPMPSEEQILSAIEAPELLEHRSLAEDRAAAVMALLGGGDDE